MNYRITLVVTVTLWVCLAGELSAQPFRNGQEAEAVYGQEGSFTQEFAHYHSESVRLYCLARSVRLDAEGRLYVCDAGNHRILRINDPLHSDSADAVYGAVGSTPTSGPPPAPSARSFNYPTDVAFDADGRMYVADFGFNRILRFDHPLTSDTADAVYGQPDFTSTSQNRSGSAPTVQAPSDSSLNAPSMLCFDREGRLYMSDLLNNRVLRFDHPLTSGAADAVYGQPDMRSMGENTGGVSARSLNSPRGVAVDRDGRLYIGDRHNWRILRFDHPLTSVVADAVYEQPGFTMRDSSERSVEATGLAIDGDGRLYCADYRHSRVLIYSSPLDVDTADISIGQPGSPVTTTAATLFDLAGLCVGGDVGKLYIAGGSRVVRYGAIGGVSLGVESEEKSTGDPDLR